MTVQATRTRPAPAGATGTQPAARSPRMTLASIRSSARSAPDRIFLMGIEGVGKSTWGSEAPAPVFLASEDGIRHLDVPVFPQPETWEDVLEALRTLATEKHDFRTIVVDTVDWLEPIVWEYVCRKGGWDNIEAPGYGKGYAVALDEWRRFLGALEAARAAGMEIVLLAHAAVKNFSDPKSEHDWSRYEVKLHRGAAALLREWCDVGLFACFEEWGAKKKGASKAKGESSGKRVIYTQHSPAYDAKSRWQLPEVLPLSYAEYAAARDAKGADQVETLKTQIKELRGKLTVDEKAAKQLDAWIAKAGDDAAKLTKVVNQLRNKVDEQSTGEAQ